MQSAARRYRDYVVGEVDGLTRDARVFTDAVRAGNLAAARAAYAPSRVRWERIEPIAGLVAELDGKLDARVDDFEGPTDPNFTGWHRLEYLLFERNTTVGGKPFADRLDADLATLKREVERLEIAPGAVAAGAGELVEEVSKGKITGEEDRYSGTDLSDIAANLQGAGEAVAVFRDLLARRDPALLADIERGLADARAVLVPYRSGQGYRPYRSLTAADKQSLQARCAALSETLSRLPAALGLT